MREYSLEDVCVKITDGAHFSPKSQEKGYPMFSVKDMDEFGFDYQSCKYINENDYNKLLKQDCIPRIGDVLVAKDGSYLKQIFVCEKDRKEGILSSIAIFRPNQNIIIPKYLMYLLKSPRVYNDVKNNYVSGSALPRIVLKDFKKVRFHIHSIIDQIKIVSILETYDKAIYLNSIINKNLEKQIKLLCRSWLVNYEPFEGVQPISWKMRSFSEIAEFISGYSYKGNELTNSSHAMATIKNFDRKGGFKLDGYKEIVPSAKLKNSHHVEPFDTLVAHTDLTQNAEVIGNAEPLLSFAGYNDIIFSMDLVKVLPKKGVSKYLITALLQDGRFKAHALGYVNGTTVLHLSKKALPEFELLLPEDLSELNPLADTLKTFYEIIANNIEESMRLTKLRNHLLPKLMSGELDVSDIEL